nr:hypothetical protein [Tanacetum cinerariifolium]GEY60860.1 hypothetical protein [Tanacetum cinerariifolium]
KASPLPPSTVSIKEIRASTDAAVQNQRASIKTLKIHIGQIRNVYKKEDLEAYLALLKPTQEIISLDPLYGDYIELNDLNVPLELRRDQVDDLMPTIKEVENMDGYQDQDMGDIIFGEPFCKASCVEARRHRDRILHVFPIFFTGPLRREEIDKYPSRKIRRIFACTSLKTTKEYGSIRRIQRSLYAIFKI